MAEQIRRLADAYERGDVIMAFTFAVFVPSAKEKYKLNQEFSLDVQEHPEALTAMGNALVKLEQLRKAIVDALPSLGGG